MTRRYQERVRGWGGRGLEGDKVAYPDPAAAPLGTDDEAGGSASRPSLHETTVEHADLARSASHVSHDRRPFAVFTLVAAAAAGVVAIMIALTRTVLLP